MICVILAYHQRAVESSVEVVNFNTVWKFTPQHFCGEKAMNRDCSFLV